MRERLLGNTASNLICLIYASSATIPLASSDLQGIVEQAQKNNTRDDVTGMLVYKNGVFLQVLEGPLPTVSDLFRKIELDRRHVNVTVLFKQPINWREFGQWSMAAQDLSSLSPDDRGIFHSYLNGTMVTTRFKSSMEFCLSLVLELKDLLE